MTAYSRPTSLASVIARSLISRHFPILLPPLQMSLTNSLMRSALCALRAGVWQLRRFRLTTAHPDRATGIIVENAVAKIEGWNSYVEKKFSPFWQRALVRCVYG